MKKFNYCIVATFLALKVLPKLKIIFLEYRFFDGKVNSCFQQHHGYKVPKLKATKMPFLVGCPAPFPTKKKIIRTFRFSLTEVNFRGIYVNNDTFYAVRNTQIEKILRTILNKTMLIFYVNVHKEHQKMKLYCWMSRKSSAFNNFKNSNALCKTMIFAIKRLTGISLSELKIFANSNSAEYLTTILDLFTVS